MRFVIALILILLFLPVATASAQSAPSDQEPAATMAETTVEEPAPPAEPEIVVSEVEIPSHEKAAADAPATQDMPQRGSFWWMVGVIVVAGVILAVLLT